MSDLENGKNNNRFRFLWIVYALIILFGLIYFFGKGEIFGGGWKIGLSGSYDRESDPVGFWFYWFFYLFAFISAIFLFFKKK